MEQILKDDIENLIKCLHQYDSTFSLEFLRNRYLPEITIKKPKSNKKPYQKRSKKTSKHFILIRNKMYCEMLGETSCKI